MTVSFPRQLGAALILGIGAQAAQADVTAQDVWSDWRAYLSASGYEVSATETMSGNTLRIGDLILQVPLAEADDPVQVSMGDLEFVENADGTVNAVFPDSIPIAIDFKNAGKAFRVNILWEQGDNTMLVSGDPSAMTHAYSAKFSNMTFTGATADGQPMPPDLMRFVLAMERVSSKTTMRLGELRNYDQLINISTLNYDAAFKAPDGNDQGSFKGTIWGLGLQGKTAIPLELTPDDMLQMLKDGLSVDGTITYSAGKTDIEGVAEGESFGFSGKSRGGYLTVKMDESQLLYDLNQKSPKVEVTSAQLPFPVSFEMAKAGFKLLMPLSTSEEEQDFAFGLTLGDFEMADVLWNIFDAAAVLPRDPASIVLDLTGKALVLVDFLDPKVAARLDQMSEPPAELNALTINQVLVSAVGAKLSGSGGFTFDNNAMTMFGGVPRPTGSVEMELVGANGLIDKIVQMGFVSAQDAMGARMMMGMLAVPGDAPDTLKSKLEINQQGHVLANGQRIQ